MKAFPSNLLEVITYLLTQTERKQNLAVKGSDDAVSSA